MYEWEKKYSLPELILGYILGYLIVDFCLLTIFGILYFFIL